MGPLAVEKIDAELAPGLGLDRRWVKAGAEAGAGAAQHGIDLQAVVVKRADAEQPGGLTLRCVGEPGQGGATASQGFEQPAFAGAGGNEPGAGMPFAGRFGTLQGLSTAMSGQGGESADLALSAAKLRGALITDFSPIAVLHREFQRAPRAVADRGGLERAAELSAADAKHLLEANALAIDHAIAGDQPGLLIGFASGSKGVQDQAGTAIFENLQDPAFAVARGVEPGAAVAGGDRQ